ncbi:hypothetical protein D7Y13_34175 [Corallococcus praedator]|uniref:DUF937 domain-containing protein n=1 Tax=Corallococcus praedator TaxID=2316724 RepID=A0ABX9Q7I5_9BACT|nr:MULTISPECIES: hypothetical protein [Corallococcus]RKH35527.1 hypothetical protein D7X75_03815 [Corallococcus sp. CA031C]RKH93692.1 hypothetical protein D7Y13_34175 [Corallococcus praedator]
MAPPKIAPRIPSTPRPSEPAAPQRARNTVKPGQGHPAASRFDTTPSGKTPVALSTPAGVVAQGNRPAPGSFPSPGDVRTIAAMKDPVARNLAITQGYHDLSNAMGSLLGEENTNWSTIASWASKQAGVSIRQEDMPKVFVDALKGGGILGGALSKADDLLRKLGLPALPLGAIAKAGTDALNATSQAVAGGNHFVFNDVGFEFARFVEAFQGDTGYDAAKVERFAASIPADKPLLREAFSHYAEAMFEKDPNKKAELVLLGNTQVGLHEQTQLQPYIEGALNAPVKDVFRKILKQSVEAGANALPFPANLAAKAAIKAGVVDAALNPLVDQLATVFRAAVTENMMRLTLPGGALKLGNDLPPPKGMEDVLFPPHLRTIENPELRALLGRLDRTPDSLHGTAAKDWSKLDQRMNFVVDLMRSRQADSQLFGSPLGKEGHYPVPTPSRPATPAVA